MMLPLALGFSTWEIVLILAVALLLFGGKKLPELARSMGRSVNEFKRGMSDLAAETPTAVDPAKPVEGDTTPPPPATQAYKFDPQAGKPLTPDTKA